ncbi:hypothetical protein MOU_17832 [Xanthomonas citri pv. malvacearum str. GSPB1386]|nr:hypothetical protein MOU_17832 [Xanthomonas citri pv. malvacearum str. GSPB1386]
MNTRLSAHDRITATTRRRITIITARKFTLIALSRLIRIAVTVTVFFTGAIGPAHFASSALTIAGQA